MSIPIQIASQAKERMSMVILTAFTGKMGFHCILFGSKGAVHGNVVKCVMCSSSSSSREWPASYVGASLHCHAHSARL